MKNLKLKFAAQKLSKQEAQSVKGGRCRRKPPRRFRELCDSMDTVYDSNGCWAGCF